MSSSAIVLVQLKYSYQDGHFGTLEPLPIIWPIIAIHGLGFGVKESLKSQFSGILRETYCEGCLAWGSRQQANVNEAIALKTVTAFLDYLAEHWDYKITCCSVTNSVDNGLVKKTSLWTLQKQV